MSLNLKHCLKFEQGTLTLSGEISEALPNDLGFVWDLRTQQWRAPAMEYTRAVLGLSKDEAGFEDQARAYAKMSFSLAKAIQPREHQAKALTAWVEQNCRGVVSLPTGAGKTILAVMAIAKLGRPTLIIVPTIDLLLQWQATLKHFFEKPIGGLGGGLKEISEITVATYDSALIFLETLGNRFGFLVVDECHHLPAPQYQSIAHGMIAPFRLGLSATVARTDGKEELLTTMLGEICYECQIKDMVSTVLSPYEIVSVRVKLSGEEPAKYKSARETYLGFVRKFGIDFRSPTGWREFIGKASRLPGGKEAMVAYREQRRLAQAASGKMREVWNILHRHREEQAIIFTDDNALAYQIGRSFVLPVLTHQTKIPERKKFLDAFRQGEIKVLVTSKVLNEGVDVPQASVAIVVSGSAGVREHVQRLGRILRHQPGKTAILYELVSEGTSEMSVNQRRRQHDAYQRSPEL